MEISILLDNLPDAISRLDRSLRYLYVNRAAETMFGAAREGMIGRTNAEIGTLQRRSIARGIRSAGLFY